jgi:uncharacterized protein
MMNVLWELPNDHSLEYFTLISERDQHLLVGHVICMLEGDPALIHYRITCDQYWQTTAVQVECTHQRTTEELQLLVTPDQHWYQDDELLPFDDLFDIDLEITPATNTLPMRRMNLRVGQSFATEAVWMRFPSLRLERLQQTYTRLNQDQYRYESQGGFTAILTVDSAGVVVNYGDLWRRVK